MDKIRTWRHQPYGKKLKKLHRWNAYIILLLAFTGLILYFPSLRGLMAQYRVGLKNIHNVLGVASIVIILLYLPLLPKHMKQIWKFRSQRYNLWFTIFLLSGWSLSGLILWQFKQFPAIWSSVALIMHDLFTYVGIPWVTYHAISRSRWLKRIERKDDKQTTSSTVNEGKWHPVAAQGIGSLISRRKFIRLGSGALLTLAIGPFFYRWLKNMVGFGQGAALDGIASSGKTKLPAPTPMPGSLPPKGGGGEGTFRMYTVTDVPTFTEDDWAFTVNGLVDKPETFNWNQFLKLPRKVQVSDFHCVTGWSVYHVTWEGILLSDLLKSVGVKSNAKYVKLYSGDGVYTDALTLKQAREDDVMIAVLRDGKPIPDDYGGPTRLIMPQMYAYKSVKWLNKIELIDRPHTGFWEKRGYDTDAWYHS